MSALITNRLINQNKPDFNKENCTSPLQTALFHETIKTVFTRQIQVVQQWTIESAFGFHQTGRLNIVYPCDAQMQSMSHVRDRLTRCLHNNNRGCPLHVEVGEVQRMWLISSLISPTTTLSAVYL